MKKKLTPSGKFILATKLLWNELLNDSKDPLQGIKNITTARNCLAHNKPAIIESNHLKRIDAITKNQTPKEDLLNYARCFYRIHNFYAKKTGETSVLKHNIDFLIFPPYDYLFDNYAKYKIKTWYKIDENSLFAGTKFPDKDTYSFFLRDNIGLSPKIEIDKINKLINIVE